ncbi:MAG: biliverdin-producing heme oxygenase [Novosphingobium sp.]
MVSDGGNLTARQELRVQTRADHTRVDEAFARFDLGTTEGYRCFLRAQAAALLPLEQALDDLGAHAVVHDWETRRRSDLLRADLVDLNADAPSDGPVPDLNSPEAILGALYVIEGSRHGGAVLERMVASALPRRFLGATDSSRWRTLVGLIDDTLVSRRQRDVALRAARDVFGLFAAAGLEQAKASVLEH